MVLRCRMYKGKAHPMAVNWQFKPKNFMRQASNQPAVFRFGNFVVDLRAGELRRNGT